MTDPIFDPITGNSPVIPSQEVPHDEPQGIFGWSEDIFNNPDIFEIPGAQVQAHDDFALNLEPAIPADPSPTIASEPIIIEPNIPDEYSVQTTEDIPEPEIIEQIIEPQIKPEVKIDPRQQHKNTNKQAQPVNIPPAQPSHTQQPVRIVRPPEIQPAQKSDPRPPQASANSQTQTPISRPVQQAAQPTKPAEVVQPTQKIQPQKSPVPETVKPVQTPQKERDIVPPPQKAVSDLQAKIEELTQITRNLYVLEKKDTEQALEVLGADNDTVTILYQFSLLDNAVLIKKIETEKTTGDELVNDLWFVHDEERNSRQVILDDVLLFDEVEHLQDEPKKKMQVTEKLNKFIFLLSEQQKKLEKEAKEKEEAESERRRLQDIFRNF